MKSTLIILKNLKVCLSLSLLLIISLKTSYGTSASESSVITVSYYSTTQNDSTKMNIYLPIGYNDITDTNHYPVFYLNHGGGEKYNYWQDYGFVQATLDTAISQGLAVPMIIVMPDCRNINPPIYTQELLNDIIPLVETNYRVIKDKDHRGVGGLSYGGMQALDAGIYNYDMFGYLAILSSGWFSAADSASMVPVRAFLDTNAAKLEKSIRYFYFAQGGTLDITYSVGMITLDILRSYGITVHYWQYEGGHQWSVWKKDLKSFIPYLFRDSTTKYVSLEFNEGNIVNPTIMTKADSVIDPPPTPTTEGYTFVDWFKESECINRVDFLTDTIKVNTTYYAKWLIQTFRVCFNSNGGTPGDDTLYVEYKSLIEAPEEPVRPGYIFDGWYTDTSFTKEWRFDLYPVRKDITLIAKWIENTTSIYNNQNPDVIIYPNPAQSYIKIINLQSDAYISIFNLEGKVVLSMPGRNSLEKINIETLPKGYYTITINCLNEFYRFKLIKN